MVTGGLLNGKPTNNVFVIFGVDEGEFYVDKIASLNYKRHSHASSLVNLNGRDHIIVAGMYFNLNFEVAILTKDARICLQAVLLLNTWT